MAKNIETERYHLIPVTDTGTTEWQQTCEIPTIHTELTLSGSHTITYLKFNVTPGKPSGLDISAGGTNLETVSDNIRAQMIHSLETSQELLQR